MSRFFRLQVPPEAGNKRLDLFLASATGLSRARMRRLIEEGRVRRVGGKGRPLKTSTAVEAGWSLEVEMPDPAPSRLVPEDLPLRIVFSDAHLAVVDKPAGLVVHPGAGHEAGTLVNALLARFPGIEGVGGVRRPGLVHRLDRGTSGLLVVALSDAAYRDLARQVQYRVVARLYAAIVQGSWSGKGRIDAPVGRDSRHRQRMAVVARRGRDARTFFRVLPGGRASRLVLFQLDTGRTHQIRVHARFAGHPLRGDALYGGKAGEGAERPMLHALRLAFRHPVDGRPLDFHAPPPEDFRACLAAEGIPEPKWEGIPFLKPRPPQGDEGACGIPIGRVPERDGSPFSRFRKAEPAQEGGP